MAWSNAQKSIAVQACRSCKLTEEQRRLILRQLPNAAFDAEGNRSDEPTSRSRRLTNADFEHFMAVVERYAGGRLLSYPEGHWQAKAEDVLQRMRFGARRIAERLEAAGRLQPGGVGLAGWIEKRVAGGRTDRIDRLDYHELHALINSLSSYARKHHVTA